MLQSLVCSGELAWDASHHASSKKASGGGADYSIDAQLRALDLTEIPVWAEVRDYQGGPWLYGRLLQPAIESAKEGGRERVSCPDTSNTEYSGEAGSTKLV